jgi:Putative zinc-finger
VNKPVGHEAYAQWDAAYVFGALSAPERTEYEGHLAGCPRCQAAVAELAGMPGLLAQVPAGEVLAMDPDELGDGGDANTAWVDEAMPLSLVHPAGPEGAYARKARARRGLAPLAAAATALVVGGLGGYAVSSASRDGAPPGSVVATGSPTVHGSVPARLAFSAVEPSSMTAVLDVVPVGNRTELRVECQYAIGSATRGSEDYSGAWSEYAIWVVDHAGRATHLKSWQARPDRVMHPTSSTTLAVSQIGSVEIRRVDTGRTVMRAVLS